MSVPTVSDPGRRRDHESTGIPTDATLAMAASNIANEKKIFFRPPYVYSISLDQ